LFMQDVQRLGCIVRTVLPKQEESKRTILDSYNILIYED
jgi:hypothetical protein